MTTATLEKRITESSSLACSFLHRGYAYTANDDPGSRNHAFILDTRPGANFGKTVGTCEISGVEFADLEAIAVSGAGNIGLGDIGDNKLVRKWINVWIAPEPDTITGHHILKARKYRLAYPDGKPKNAETLLFHPTAKRRYIVTKEDDRARVYAFPEKLSRWRVNKLQYVGTIHGLKLATDASLTPSSLHAAFREKGRTDTVAIVHWPTLTLLKRMRVTAVKQPESIAIEWDAKHFLYGSEGPGSPLHRDPFPEEYR